MLASFQEISVVNKLKSVGRHKKICFYTGINLSSETFGGHFKVDKYFGCTKEHLINRGSKIYTEMVEIEHLSNVVPCSRFLNCSISDFNVAMKLHLLEMFKNNPVEINSNEFNDQNVRNQFKKIVMRYTNRVRDFWDNSDYYSRCKRNNKDLWHSENVVKLEQKYKHHALQETITYWNSFSEL